jgi:MoaA/NifB/PqqE/SkfB family radical SAM enzyme
MQTMARVSLISSRSESSRSPGARSDRLGASRYAGLDVLNRPIGGAPVRSASARTLALAADPGLREAYAAARRVRRAIRPVMTVEVTSTCNLFCEGCCYFHDDFEAKPEPEDVGEWRDFFKAEWAQGKRYAIFHGAEPALKQDRLMAAGEVFQRGIIYTNGTLRMNSQIPFVRNVSIWGDEESTAKVRGGSTYRKALRNFENDARARFSIIVSAQNYRQLPVIIADLVAAGVSATVSYFSPSYSYLDKLTANAPNDAQFYRFSSEADNMMLSQDDFARANDLVEELAARHPRTLLQGRDYNRWLTAPGSRFTLDEDGYAAECAVRQRSAHELYGTDLKPIEAKCALADTDCAHCRIVPATTTSVLHNARLYAGAVEDFLFWIETAFQAGRFFLRDDDRQVWRGAPPPPAAWREHYGVTTGQVQTAFAEAAAGA